MPRKKATKKDKATEKKDSLKSRIDAVCSAVNKVCPSEWSDDDPIMTLKGDKISKIPTFSTGSISLDMKMGGGYAWGRIVEIYGPESSGKSTLCLHAIANVQNEDPNMLCALIDSENSFDALYAQKLGVDVERLLVSQPDSGEHALNIMMELVRNDVKLVIVDSVAALTPKDMFEAAIGTVTMGKHAKMMSEGIRNLNTLLSKKRSTVLFTNQVRTQIGVAHASMAGSTTGGKALRFYASQRVELKRIGSDKSGEEIINNIVKAKVAKNKIAPPFQVATFKIRFGKGIDPIDQIIDFGIDEGLIDKGGAWYSIPMLDNQKFQGLQNLYDFLDGDEEARNKMNDAVMKIIDGTGVEQDPETHTPDEEMPEDEDLDVMSTIEEKGQNEDIDVEEI
jgi:recombination protein RecA